MGDLKNWERTTGPDFNNDAQPHGAMENWSGEDVNNWGREVMAAVRRNFDEDTWRNVIAQPISVGGGANFLVTRVDASTIQIQSGTLDLTPAFPNGRIVRINGDGGQLCIVTGQNFDNPNTTVNLQVFDVDRNDPAVPLGTSTLTFVAGSSQVTDSGTDTFNGVKDKDIVIVQEPSENAGAWTVLGDPTNLNKTLTLECRARSAGGDFEFVMHDEVFDSTAGVGDDYQMLHVALNGDLPGSVTGVETQGAHYRELAEASGYEAAQLPANVNLGTAAYKRARDLQAGGLRSLLPPIAGQELQVVQAHASIIGDYQYGPKLPPVLAGQAGLPVVINQAEDGYTVGQPLFDVTYFIDTTIVDAYDESNQEALLTPFAGLAYPGPQDGVFQYRITFQVNLTNWNQPLGTGVDLRLRNGQTGGLGDAEVYAITDDDGANDGDWLCGRVPFTGTVGAENEANIDPEWPNDGFNDFPFWQGDIAKSVVLSPAANDVLSLTLHNRRSGGTRCDMGAGTYIRIQTYVPYDVGVYDGNVLLP